jgi:hypothetical protein
MRRAVEQKPMSDTCEFMIVVILVSRKYGLSQSLIYLPLLKALERRNAESGGIVSTKGAESFWFVTCGRNHGRKGVERCENVGATFRDVCQSSLSGVTETRNSQKHRESAIHKRSASVPEFSLPWHTIQTTEAALVLSTIFAVFSETDVVSCVSRSFVYHGLLDML